MKKLMVFGISFASCMVVFLMTIFIFKEPITNYLVSNNNLKLVGVLYGKNTLYDVVARNNYISYKKNIDSNVISGSVSSDNVSNDKYEKEILEKDDSTEGYKFINIEINGYKSYLIAIYDHSKVKLVSSRWFNRGNTGQQTVIDICKRYNGKVCINGGGFQDFGLGSDIPIGYVIEDGKITWDSEGKSKLVGFNYDNELVLMTASGEEAIAAGVRDALEFGPFLIDNGEIIVPKEESAGGYGGAARVAIAQRNDGIVLFLVTEGVHSKGPTIYEVAETLKKYGAYTAGNLDGGASSSLVVNGKMINHPLNIYGELINGGRGRSVVTGFGYIE